MLALLLGLCGGAVMAAAAGARRRASAFPPLLDATDSFDVLVKPDQGDTDSTPPSDCLRSRWPVAERAGSYCHWARTDRPS